MNHKLILSIALLTCAAMGLTSCGDNSETVKTTALTADQQIARIESNPHMPAAEKAAVIARLKQGSSTAPANK